MEKQIQLIIFTFISSIILNSCSSEEHILYLKNYPIVFPFEEGECNGMELKFAYSSKFEDTIEAKISIINISNQNIDFNLSGYSKFFLKNRNNNNIYLYPKLKDRVGFYTYTLFFDLDFKEVKQIALFFNNREEILYKKGDRIKHYTNNYCLVKH